MSLSGHALQAAPQVDLASGGSAGKDREIFKKYLKPTGREAPPALLLKELPFFFFCYLLASKSLMKDLHEQIPIKQKVDAI